MYTYGNNLHILLKYKMTTMQLSICTNLVSLSLAICKYGGEVDLTDLTCICDLIAIY